jgi:hypothetical protein
MTRLTMLDSSRGLRVMLACVALLFAVVARPAIAQNDVSVAAILAPQSGCALTNFENVSLRILNYGSTLPAASSFNVSYTINAGAPVVEMITLASPLSSNSALIYTFTTQANLSTAGMYTFNATVSLAGDVSPANDAFSGYTVMNSAPSIGGTIAGAPPGSSGTLTLSGNNGNVAQWEESEDGELRWFVLANETTTLDFANLRRPTAFRARVSNGACPDAYSNIAIVTP